MKKPIFILITTLALINADTIPSTVQQWTDTGHQYSSVTKVQPLDVSGINQGTLIVKTYPEGCPIYVNGEFLGMQNITLINLKPGLYSVKAKYNSNEKEERVLVLPADKKVVFFSLKRRLSLVAAFYQSFYWTNAAFTLGPKARIGFKHDDFVYSLMAIIHPRGSDKKYHHRAITGGGFFDIRYEGLNANDIFYFTPSIAVGFVYNEYDSYSFSNWWDSHFKETEEYEFGELGLTMRLGYRYVWFTIDNALLLGTKIGYSLSFGLTLQF